MICDVLHFEYGSIICRKLANCSKYIIFSSLFDFSMQVVTHIRTPALACCLKQKPPARYDFGELPEFKKDMMGLCRKI